MNLKRILCTLLTAVLVIGLCPMIASANTADAIPLTFGTPVSEVLSQTETYDEYRFTVSETGYVSFHFAPTAEVSPNSSSTLEIINSDNITLRTFYPKFTEESTTDGVLLAAGDYTCKLKAYEGHDIPYAFTANFSKAQSLDTANNSFASAPEIALNTPCVGTISDAADADYYRLTIPEMGYITVSFENCYSHITGSTWSMSFYGANKDGTPKAEKAFSYTYQGSARYVKVSPKIGVAPGEYYVVMEKANFHSDVPYGFQVSFTQTDDYETLDNNTKGSAQKISLSQTYNGNLAAQEDEDWYVFTVPEKGYITASFDHYKISDYNEMYYKFWSLSIYNANDRYLVGDSSRALDIAKIPETGLNPGTYYLKIERAERYSDGWYQFKVSFTPHDYYETAPNSTFDTANTLSLNRYMYGFASLGGDYFRLNVPNDGYVDFQITSNALKATLYDPQQNPICYFNEKNNEVDLTAGTYYLHVKCDQSKTSYGSSYSIFVTDYTHSHSYTEDIIPATCTTKSRIKYSCNCGHSYTDAGKDAALGHDWEEWHYADPNAAALSDKEERSCSRCKTTQSHWLSDHDHYFTINEPTCTEDGYVQYHCSDGWSNISKDNIIAATDHKWNNGKVTKEPTVEAEGEMTFTCTKCKETKTEPIEKLTPTPEPIDNPFTDVKESDWYFAPVMWAKESGVTGGTSATTFGPNDGCTRAQVVTFLWAANGKPEPKSMDNPFTDVPNNAWYLQPVLWAVEQGITTGTSASTFGPDQTCTRAQIATFLYAAKGKPPVSGTSPFDDVADTDWYAKPVIWAKENDVTGGINATRFGPNQVCTRAQVVTFLYKVYG